MICPLPSSWQKHTTRAAHHLRRRDGKDLEEPRGETWTSGGERRKRWEQRVVWTTEIGCLVFSVKRVKLEQRIWYLCHPCFLSRVPLTPPTRNSGAVNGS